MVPNDFTVELGAHDYERLATYAGPLSAELAELLQDHGREQRYMFVGPVEVKFERVQDLSTGMFRIRSQALAGVVQVPGYPPQAPGYGAPQQPPGYPPMPEPAPAFPPQQPPGFGQQPPAPGFGAPVGGAPGYPSPAQAGPGTCWIEVNGVRHPLSRAVTSLGRGTDVDLRIDDPSVSRRHAEIRVGVPSVISDLGSTNGIVVDDQHVRQAQLRDGSVIHLGNTTIIFRQETR